MFDDPAILAKLKEGARKQIRSRMRSLRGAHPERALQERSARIVERVLALEAYGAARSVALFWPLESEVDLRALDVHARAVKKRIYYPFLQRSESAALTGFALVEDVGELVIRGSRFKEPRPEAPRAARGDIDLVLVPALAASPNGHRLGYGVGFYDATLPDVTPPAFSVIVVYDFQFLGELPELEHDVACDCIATDQRTVFVPRSIGGRTPT